MRDNEFVSNLLAILSPDVEVGAVKDEDIIVLHMNKIHLLKNIEALKNHKNFAFKCLMDITCVDYPDRAERFEIVYNLLSLKNNKRIIIKLLTNDLEDEDVPSITPIFCNACWFEREVFDMFGVIFSGNNDLRRILTDYGFQGHPLRKDFPLTGYLEVKYDAEKQKVIYVPVELPQEYRHFDFLSPWEGTEYNLPGDEKANQVKG